MNQRHRQPEIMDEPDLDPCLHLQALRALARVNFLSGSSGILWREIRPLARERPERRLRLLDVASGGGDVSLQLWRRAQRHGLLLDVEGCDISPRAVAYAQERAAAQRCPVRFFQRDVLAEGIPTGYDVLTASLFLHHLDDDQALELLRGMAAGAGEMLLVNDLRRGRLHYGLAWLATRVLTASRVVHVDGPLSVQAAFSLAEVRQLASRAGLEGARVVKRWPFRFLLRWRRTNHGTDDSRPGHGGAGHEGSGL